VHTTGNFFGDFEFFSEGIFVFGDGFYIANHGSIRVEGESSSTMVGVGAKGPSINNSVNLSCDEDTTGLEKSCSSSRRGTRGGIG
jgi:hypothetical protein